MVTRRNLSTRAFGAEPGIPDVAVLAAWIADHRGTPADIITYLLDQSLAPQLEAGIISPCAGGRFYKNRIMECLTGVKEGQVTGEIHLNPHAIIEDSAGIVLENKGTSCALPAPHLLGLTDTYYHDEQEWNDAITGLYRDLMRSMRDTGIKGHVLICSKIHEPEIESLTLVPSEGGRFEVSSNGKLLYSKLETHRHAEPGEVAGLVRKPFRVVESRASTTGSLLGYSMRVVVLVVWQGEDDTLGLADGETEIFGQRLNAANGSQVGTDDFRISSMGPDNNNAFDAAFPDVAFDAQLVEYLVVWQGDDNINGLVDDEREIFGQRLDANGAQVNGAEFRLSNAGTDGSSTFIASIPSVAYNSTGHSMFTIWQADDDGDESGVVDNEFEIFGELRDSENILGSEDDLRYSTMGADFGNGFMAATAYNSINQEFLVVWVGTGNHPGEEIYTQRIDTASGEQIGANDFRITDIGEDVANVVKNPQVAYNSTDNEYLVVWIGDDISGGLGEKEVFGQRLNAATGAEVGTAIVRNTAGSGPTPNGKRLATITTKNTDMATSARRRMASNRSRRTTPRNASHRLGRFIRSSSDSERDRTATRPPGE